MLHQRSIKDVTSDWNRMVLGCPQPARLEFVPKWHVIPIPDKNLSMYADDHQMYATGKKHDVVAQSIKTQNESKFHIILVQEQLSLNKSNKVSATYN